MILDRQVCVGKRLCFHTLRRVNDEQSALTGGEAPGYLVAEVHVTGRVDQVEGVVLPVPSPIIQTHGRRLDRDPAFPLQVHGVQNLRRHLPLRERTGELQQPIRQRRLAVIDVRDDGKVTDVA